MAKDAIVAFPRNYGQQWSFLKTTGYISTTAKHTTGNINVTQYATGIAGGATSPVFTSAMVGRLLIVSGGTIPYRIASFTSVTAITLETPYLGSTATNQSYSIVQDNYPLASDFNGIIKDTVKVDGELPLDFLSETEFEDTFFNSVRIETPLYYGFPGMVGSGTNVGRHQIALREGYPDVAMGVSYKYYRSLSDLSADGDISLIGYAQGGDNALILGSIWLLRQFERESWDDGDIAEAKTDFDMAMQTMWVSNKDLTEDYDPSFQIESGYLGD